MWHPHLSLQGLDSLAAMAPRLKTDWVHEHLAHTGKMDWETHIEAFDLVLVTNRGVVSH